MPKPPRTAIAGLVGYLVSDSFRERLAQKQRDKIASEVARGDEAAVNARIGRFRALGPWVLLALVVIVGCAVTRTVYVREQDKATALRPVATASTAANAFVNDPANQLAARDAVMAVARDGLSGNEALDAAVKRLRDAGLAAGRDAATTLLRTLVQLVYAVGRVSE